MKDNFSNELEKTLKQLFEKYFPLGHVIQIRPEMTYFDFLYFPGTYILYAHNSIIYIGVSINVGRRILSHLNSKSENSFGQDITKIKIIRFDTWAEAASLENYLINKFKPKFNKTIPSPGYDYIDRVPYESRLFLDKTIQQIALNLRKNSSKTRRAS